MRNLRYKKHKIYLRILKRWLLCLVFKRCGFYRTPEFIAEQYDPEWRGSIEDFDKKMSKRTTRELNGRLVQWRAIDIRKFRISQLNWTIIELSLMDNVKSVLELGSGDGFNILALAALHPEVNIWRGIELTPQGVVAANLLLANPPFKHLRYVTGLEVETIRKRLRESDIQFKEGNMLNLPFPGGSFDTVFTCQAIEQLPRDYPRAFQEAKRVTTKYAFFLEEFLEAQNMFNRMHLQNVDYFRASYQEVEKAGFKVLKFEPFPLDTFYLRLGLLVCSADG